MAELTKGVFPAPFQDPFADAETQPFWDAAKEGRLTASRCTTCGTHLLPPQPRCFNCQGTGFEWVDLPGTGTIYTFTVVRHPLAPHLAEVVPYASGVIQLDGTEGGGARMISNIIDCDPEKVAIGDRVRVVFEQVSDTLALPRFTPIDR
jgi:uncharacterized OB-fold protein